uniref:Serine/arginine repetitive matrix protein 1-like n=1 Tax=Parastrongyloides trichosuri TaxID=131310 RepID=A0A0N4ZZV2_PARTI
MGGAGGGRDDAGSRKPQGKHGTLRGCVSTRSLPDRSSRTNGSTAATGSAAYSRAPPAPGRHRPVETAPSRAAAPPAATSAASPAGTGPAHPPRFAAARHGLPVRRSAKRRRVPGRSAPHPPAAHRTTRPAPAPRAGARPPA